VKIKVNSRRVVATFRPGADWGIDLYLHLDPDGQLDGLQASLSGEIAPSHSDIEPLASDSSRQRWCCSMAHWPLVREKLEAAGIVVSDLQRIAERLATLANKVIEGAADTNPCSQE
jgi:hypothetical protein